MRKSLVLAAMGLMAGSVAHAEQKNNAFACMDKTTFEINSQCMEKSIGQHAQFKEMQVKIDQQSQMLGDKAMASLTYYPKDGIIEVVAHTDAAKFANQLAMLKPQK